MKQGKTILLIVIALAVLGLLIWVGSNQSTMPNGDNTMEEGDNMEQTENNSVDNSENMEEGEENEESQANELPPAVFNTSGEITNISSDSITVLTDGSHMTSGESTEVTVSITGTTNILDADNNSISLSDLNEGDNVSIEGSVNIKDLEEFPGSNIKLVN